MSDNHTCGCNEGVRAIELRLDSVSRIIDKISDQYEEVSKVLHQQLQRFETLLVEHGNEVEAIKAKVMDPKSVEQAVEHCLVSLDNGLNAIKEMRATLDERHVKRLEALGTQVANLTQIGQKTAKLENAVSAQAKVIQGHADALTTISQYQHRVEHQLNVLRKDLDGAGVRIGEIEAATAKRDTKRPK